jgi:hypothetical protein
MKGAAGLRRVDRQVPPDPRVPSGPEETFLMARLERLEDDERTF